MKLKQRQLFGGETAIRYFMRWFKSLPPFLKKENQKLLKDKN